MEGGLPKKFRERFAELGEIARTSDVQRNVQGIISITKRKTVNVKERYSYKIMPGRARMK